MMTIAFRPMSLPFLVASFIALPALSPSVLGRDEGHSTETSSKVTRSVESSLELGCLEPEILTRNGNERQEVVAPEGGMRLERNSQVKVVEEAFGGEGKHQSLRRHFKTDAMLTKAAIFGKEDEWHRKSSLEGRIAEFSWDDNDAKYSCKLLDSEGNDSQVEQQLRHDLNLAFLLTDERLEKDATWDVSIERLSELLVPGGRTSPFPSATASERPNAGSTQVSLLVEPAALRVPLDVLLADAKGKIEVVFSGEASDSRTFELRVEAEADADVSDLLLPFIESGIPPEVTVNYRHTTASRLIGTGTFTWDPSRSMLADLDMEYEVTINEDIHSTLAITNADTGETIDIATDMMVKWNGTLDLACRGWAAEDSED